MQPDTRWAELGEDRIAYQILGEGPLDLIFVGGMAGHVDVRWEEPSYASFLRRLASFSRLIMFDRRGSGASDPVSLAGIPSWEAWSDDVRAVLDAAGSERAAILAQADGGAMAILFAATEPERTTSLILANTAAKFRAGDGYEFGQPEDQTDQIAESARMLWGTEAWVDFGYPSMAKNITFRRWFAKYQRASCSPREAAVYMKAQTMLDVRRVLPTLRVPTLVLHRKDCIPIPVGHGRYLAEHIPGAKYIELPGVDAGIFVEDSNLVLDHVEEFLTGVRGGGETDRVLATVLFTDIVGSTDLASQMGDRHWTEVLGAHDQLARTHVERFRGRVIKTTGDGLVATFEGPGRALRCAFALIEGLKASGVDIRAGIHTGEIELLPADDIGGISVHIAARVMGEAGSGEVVVSRTVKDLVAGSGFVFDDLGQRTLKGIPESWQLFTARAT